jgi:hypothetical protein
MRFWNFFAGGVGAASSWRHGRIVGSAGRRRQRVQPEQLRPSVRKRSGRPALLILARVVLRTLCFGRLARPPGSELAVALVPIRRFPGVGAFAWCGPARGDGSPPRDN